MRGKFDKNEDRKVRYTVSTSTCPWEKLRVKTKCLIGNGLELVWRRPLCLIGDRSLSTFFRQSGLYQKYLMRSLVISFTTTIFRGEKAENGSCFSYKLRWSRSESGQKKYGPEIRHGGKPALLIFSCRWSFPVSWAYWHFPPLAFCSWSLRAMRTPYVPLFPAQSNCSAPTSSLKVNTELR